MAKPKFIRKIRKALFPVFKPFIIVGLFIYYSYQIILRPFFRNSCEGVGGILKILLKVFLEPRMLFLLLVPFGNFIYYVIVASGPTIFPLGYHIFSWVYWFGGVIIYGFIGQYT